MKTDADMTGEVIRILDEGTPDGHTAYDVSGIVQACHREAGGWNMALVSTERFWQIVQAIDVASRSHPRETVGPTAENLVTLLVKYYAERRNGHVRVSGYELLIQAYVLTHGASIEEADVAISELLENIYANAG